MMPFSRLVATLTAPFLAAVGASWDCPMSIAAPPEQAGVPSKSSVYDSNPEHLWNRLHRALWVRTSPDGKEYGHDRLDPYLWRETRHLLEGDSHKQVIALLDEFLSARGESLVK